MTLEDCRKYLKDKNLSDKRIEEIRDFLYALTKEIVTKNIKIAEKSTQTKDVKSVIIQG